MRIPLMRILLLSSLLILYSTAPPPCRRVRSTHLDNWYQCGPARMPEMDTEDLTNLPGQEKCHSGNRYSFRNRGAAPGNNDKNSADLPTHQPQEKDNDGKTPQSSSNDKEILAKEEEERSKCYFHKLRQTRHETKLRTQQSTVSTDCKGETTTMKDFIEETNGPLFEAKNSLALILCRGAGLCDLDFDDQDVVEYWSKRRICQEHKKELLTEWPESKFTHIIRKRNSPENPVCSMNSNVGDKHRERPSLKHKYENSLNIHEADAILQKTGHLVHPGTPMCNAHKKFAQLVSSQHQIEKKGRYIDPPPASGLLAESETIESESHNSCSTAQNDEDYHPPRVNTPRMTPGVEGPVAKTWTTFAKTLQKYGVSTRKPFTELTYRTQRRKAIAGKNILDVTCKMLAPESHDDLKNMICDTHGNDLYLKGRSDKYGRLLNFVSERYMQRENRMEGYTVLALVAPVASLSEMRSYIPGLSSHVYKEARKIKIGKQPPKKQVRERRAPEAINEFITFITSNNIMLPHTFGMKKSKFSDGSIAELPNTIRMASATRTIEMYKQYLADLDREELALGDSTYYKILSTCAATPMKAAVCVDYFLADGIEAGFFKTSVFYFILQAAEKIQEILRKWHSSQFIDEETFLELSKELTESFDYFRYDYRLHVKLDSRIADHCGRHSLSDPDRPDYSSDCNHDHDLRCERCEKAKNVIGDIRDQARFLVETADKIFKSTHEKTDRDQKDSFVEDEKDIFDAEMKIFDLKKHFMRAKITDNFRSDIIENLQSNEAMLTLDFAQKLLPMKHTETQIEYFGKRGMSYHIGHVVANISKQHVTHNFIHILRGELQDSDAVTSVIGKILEDLKKMGVQNVIIRSDNAGCYHSASTIASMFSLSEETGVEIKRWAFSEVQNGKSSSDRVAALAKKKIHTYVNFGGNITDVEEFFTALTSEKLLKGTSIFLSRVVRLPQKETTKIASISSLYDFSYNFEEKIMRASKYYKFGNGILIPDDQLKANTAYLVHEAYGGYHAGKYDGKEEAQKILEEGHSDFWYTSKCSNRKNCREEDEEEKLKPKISDNDVENDKAEEFNNGLFQCPEPGCSATYIHYGNLQNHLVRGKHSISPQRVTLRDRSLNLFIARIEDVNNTPIKAVEEAMMEIAKTPVSETANLKRGWALKVRKPIKRFSDAARKFIIALFEEGKRTGEKFDGKAAEEKMKNAENSDGSKMFHPDRRLSARQISSLFTRLHEKDRYNSNSRTKRATEEEMEEMNDDEVFEKEKELFDQWEEDEWSPDYELVWLKNPTTPDLQTEMWKLVSMNLAFIYGEEEQTPKKSKTSDSNYHTELL